MIRRVSLVILPPKTVIYHAPTITTAASVAMGIMDTSVVRVLSSDVPEINAEKTFFLYEQKSTGVVSFSKVDQAQVTPDMEAKRKLARLRGPSLYTLEVVVERALDKNNSFYDSELDAFLAFSLLRSGRKSGAVREYAETLGIDDEAAYCELLHRVETRGLEKVKNYASYVKFRDAINVSDDLKEIETLVNQAAWL